MIDEKNVWKIQVYSERAWHISSDLAVEAGRLGRNGKGIAIVANESRRIANILFQAIDKIKTSGEFNIDLSDVLWQMNQLVLNGAIETIRLDELDDSIHTSKSISVAMENMRILTNNLVELLDNETVEYIPTPEITQPSPVTNNMLFLFQSAIGGVHFVENIRYIVELIAYRKNDGIINNEIMLRGTKIPVIDCYNKFGLINHKRNENPYGCAAIINVDWYAPDNIYAVLVDDFNTNSIFRSKIGMRSEPKEIVFSSTYIRESWDAAENKQFIFPDWVRIFGKK